MSQTEIEGARLFREAWIAGVRRHFPGEPKAGYVTPWDETPPGYVADWADLPAWQQETDVDIFDAMEAALS
ncbi:hypothetical protein [Streptomyces sp. NPDC059452]|uniref:hypothetical protein n=1 Tax=Streptomyces sp. NPDC059452 TaxID=3346835 RepID=UPI0036A92C24